MASRSSSMRVVCSEARRPSIRRSKRNDGVDALLRASSVPKSVFRTDDDAILSRGHLQDHRICGAREPKLAHVHHVVPSSPQVICQPRGKVLVNQEPHAGLRSGSSRSSSDCAA